VSEPRAMRRSAEGRVVLAVAAVAMLTACSGADDLGRTAGGDASCAFIVRFRGTEYVGVQVAVEPIPGKMLGYAVLPPCDGTGRHTGDHGQRVAVAAFPGLRPGVALTWARNEDSVFVRKGLSRLPDPVAALVHPPRCFRRDAPLRLSGSWLGIVGADGKTELDLLPPYDVMLRVNRASSPRYERADLSVRVRPSLGTPLTHEDIKTSLWHGGTMSVTAACQGGRFVAESLRTDPPP
jgi:hypothetical protein